MRCHTVRTLEPSKTSPRFPTSGEWPNDDRKEYPIEIAITDDPERVRANLTPGMTAEVTVICRELKDDVLQVPVQGIVTIRGRRLAWVLTSDGPQRRDMRIGETNDSMMAVLDGVAAGERIILHPRDHFADEIRVLQKH